MQTKFFEWIQSTWLSHLALQSWIFTSMETIHFMGLSILLASVAILDLRILKVLKRIPIVKLFDLIPLAVLGFIIQLLSGITMFSATPAKYWNNIGFKIKMCLLVIAGLNALWFWIFEHRALQGAAPGQEISLSAKIVAALSLGVWLLVLTCGRIIAYLDGFTFT